VQKFYDDNKDRFYREKPKAAAAAPADAAVPPAAVPAETNEQPAAAPAEANEKPAAEPAGAEDTPQSQPEKQAEEKEPQSRVGRSRFMLAAFRQPAAADAPAAKTEPQPPAAPEPAAAAEPATTAAAPPEPASKPDAPATKPDAPATKPDAPAPETTGPKADEKQEPAPGAAAAAEKTEVAYEPLDAVKDDVRKRLAGEAANRRIDAVFAAVTADVARYAEDLALWRSQGDATIRAPEPPDVEAIAKRQGLEGATLERIEAVRALAEAPVAATFQLAADPESPMGFRQLTWAELLYGRDAPMLRPVTTRDVAGNRYLSWKTDDQPAVAPEFAAARADVERAWRIVEARPLARKVAEEIAAQVQAGATLADAVAKRTGDPKLEIVKAGPFAWLSRGGASFGSAASLSQPDGLSMPGEEHGRRLQRAPHRLLLHPPRRPHAAGRRSSQAVLRRRREPAAAHGGHPRGAGAGLPALDRRPRAPPGPRVEAAAAAVPLNVRHAAHAAAGVASSGATAATTSSTRMSFIGRAGSAAAAHCFGLPGGTFWMTTCPGP
jgi:hypothetical protein